MSREQENEFGEVAAHPRRPPDAYLVAGSDPKPPGRGWVLADYEWDEDTGVARLVYRRRWNRAERYVVEVEQPAQYDHNGWRHKPPIHREPVLRRYFESQLEMMRMQALGAYGMTRDAAR